MSIEQGFTNFEHRYIANCVDEAKTQSTEKRTMLIERMSHLIRRGKNLYSPARECLSVRAMQEIVNQVKVLNSTD